MKHYCNIFSFLCYICFFLCAQYIIATNHEDDRLEIFRGFLGKGYDIMYGYPFPNKTFVEDPGFRDKIITTINKIKSINDVVCKRDEYLTVIEGINDFMDLILYYINIEESDSIVRPFSASIPYNILFENLELKRKKYVISQNICKTYYATFNLSDSVQFMNNDFLIRLNELPWLTNDAAKLCPPNLYTSEADNEKCLNGITPWMQLFNKYGTHLLTAAHFGGITLNLFEISKMKAKEIKLNQHFYSIKNFQQLLIDYVPSMLVDSFHRKKEKEKEKEKENEDENENENENEDENLKGDEESVPWSLDTKGGLDISSYKGELTYEIWKNSVNDYFVPIYLNLMPLSSLMTQDKKESYDIALSYYNNMLGLNTKKLFLSKDIKDILSVGMQVSGAGFGHLTLVCPPDSMIGSGFIISINNTIGEEEEQEEEEQADALKDSRIKIHPCTFEKGSNISCSYKSKQESDRTMGWIYCVKNNYINYETHYKNTEDGEVDKPLEIQCSQGYAMGAGFYIELEKGSNLREWKIGTCVFGAKNCSLPQNVQKDGNYVMWGFCIPSDLNNINSVNNFYISDTNITTEIYAQCRNKESIPQPIYLGFTFFFNSNLSDVQISNCMSKHKECTNQLAAMDDENYVGTFLVCKSDNYVENFKIIDKENKY